MSQTVDPIAERDLDRLDLGEIKRFLIRRWRTIVAVFMGCVVLAGVVCVALTPVYTATSQVLLDPRRQHVFGQDGVGSDSGLDSSVVDSQIPIIMSTRLLAKVVTKENLADDPEFGGTARPGLLDRLFGMFRAAKVSKAEAPSLDGVDPKLAPVIVRLFNKVDVARVAKSYVLSLSVSSRDAGKATRLANALAQTYVEDQISVHAKSVQQAAAFFEDRLGSLREQVRESERAVADFRKAHDLTTTIMDGPITVSEQQLQDLNEKLATASVDSADRLAQYQQATRFRTAGTDLDSLPQVMRSPVITQLRTQQADLTRRESDLSVMYGAAYPAIAQIRAQRAGLERAIEAEVRRLVATLKNDSEVAKTREDLLRRTIAGLTNVSGGDNDVGVKLRELQRTNLANKALFENFLNRAKLTQEQSTFEEPDARLISPALEPSAPSSPKTKLIIPVAGVAGLLLGLALAALLDVLRARSVTAPNANAFILGRVPDVADARGRADCVAYRVAHPASEFSRSIDRLVAKIAGPALPSATSRPEDAARAGRVFVLASLSAGEGATSLAMCIAAAAGEARRVLVIDADQRRHGLSSSLAVDGSPGLSDVLDGDLSANTAVRPQERFLALSAGQKPLDPTASAKALRTFLVEARARFDLVLIDAPALDAGPDALALAALSDGFALVACWDQLLREDFIAAVDAIADKPAFAGIILNRTQPSTADRMEMAS